MKLYILTCKKLSRSQQFVQGTHAAIQYTIDNKLVENPALVMLSCPEIELWADNLKELGHKCSQFNETYYNNKLTAIAVTDIEKLVCELKLI